MEIQFDTAHNIHADESFKAPLIALLKVKLERFNQEVTRPEVHLSDENGNKEGVQDKRCLLEAHIAGMTHVVATDHSESYELAVDGASDKLVASLHAIHEHESHSHKASPQDESI